MPKSFQQRHRSTEVVQTSDKCREAVALLAVSTLPFVIVDKIGSDLSLSKSGHHTEERPSARPFFTFCSLPPFAEMKASRMMELVRGLEIGPGLRGFGARSAMHRLLSGRPSSSRVVGLDRHFGSASRSITQSAD